MKEKMNRKADMRISFSLIVACMLIVGCGGKKQGDEIIVERDVVEAHKSEVIGMPENKQSDQVKWVSATPYTYTITRTKDETLPKVTNHDQEYYDNSINLVIERSDSTVYFQKKFTKKDFDSVLPKAFRENGVLLGMNMVKADGNSLQFVVSVGSPDENNEEFYLLRMKLDNFGKTKIETYQVPEEEMTE